MFGTNETFIHNAILGLLKSEIGESGKVIDCVLKNGTSRIVVEYLTGNEKTIIEIK